MHPRVSVVIPTYNVEAYLAAALDSVLAQTLTDVEVVVVDDASTDRTVAVAERYRDCRVRVFRNARNRGPSHSRNVAIDHARGAWVAMLDADDWWKADRLERLLALAEVHRADIVCDDLLLVPEGASQPASTFFTVHAGRLGPIDRPLALYFYRARSDSLIAHPVRCLSGILEMTETLLRTVDARTHGEVVAALEGYRQRKREGLVDARFREPFHDGRWRECLALALKNPASLLRYLAVVGERVLPLGLLMTSMG